MTIENALFKHWNTTELDNNDNKLSKSFYSTIQGQTILDTKLRWNTFHLYFVIISVSALSLFFIRGVSSYCENTVLPEFYAHLCILIAIWIFGFLQSRSKWKKIKNMTDFYTINVPARTIFPKTGVTCNQFAETVDLCIKTRIFQKTVRN